MNRVPDAIFSRLRTLGCRAASVGVLLAGVLLAVSACGPGAGRARVVVYAAQDRVHAEPLFAEFTRRTGIEVLAVHDNEATKTVGLANRLLGERARPQADLWWSNEEMRTRQLAASGVLEPDWVQFGVRRRVLVCRSNDLARLPAPLSLEGLTRPGLAGKVCLAYPLFGTTSTHFLMLRQRWGEERWAKWCSDLLANRPLMVDGNSMVVRRVAAGDAVVGLTDTDDAEAARREGVPLAVLPLAGAEDLAIPNTVAVVRGAPRREAALALREFLLEPGTRKRLVDAGALSDAPVLETAGAGVVPGSEPWPALLETLDAATRRMEALFRR